MSILTRRGRILSIGAVASAALALATLGQGAAPVPDPAPAPSDPKPGLLRRIATGRECRACHENRDKLYENANVICRMTESLTCEKDDKHTLAYRALHDEAGQAIGTRLGFGKDLAATEWRACLSCHSVVDWTPAAGDGATASIESGPIPFNEDRKLAEGVSCVACHGAYEEWVGSHSRMNKNWRQLTRADKARDYGMIDLWDPVTRLRKCASCHVGDAGEGKVVTHAMYAAGHPPLPGLEVATFSKAMPHHWEYLREKLARIEASKTKTEVRAALRKEHPDLNKLEQTELVAVGGLVPLRASLALLVSDIERREAARRQGAATGWPDFARYDCYACHHDVTRTSWRQSRPFADAPGRPPAPPWPEALVELSVSAARGEGAAARQRLDRYRAHLRAFNQALGARPFGERRAVLAAATALDDWAAEELDALRGSTFDRPLALRLLRETARAASDPRAFPDYDTARQHVWAFRAIYDEIEPKPTQATAIETALKELDERYRFHLPDPGRKVKLEATLPAREKALARFDPAEFQRLFRAIAARLEPDGTGRE